MKTQFLSALLVFSFVLLSGCESDDESDSNIPGNTPDAGTITATIDGEDFSSSSPFVTAIVSEGNNGSYTISIGGVTVSGGVNEGVTIGLVGSDFLSLSAGSEFSGQNSNELAVGGYTQDAEGGDEINASSDDNESALCTITSIDFDEKLISGTFSFEAEDNATGQVIIIEDGVFTDVSYTYNPSGENPVASVSAEIDGVPFTSSGLFVVGTFIDNEILDNYLLVAGSQYQGDLAQAISLNLFTEDLEGSGSGVGYSGANDDFFFFGQYNADDDDSIDFESRSDSVASATCTITDIDTVNKLVSGEFSFDSINEDTNEIYEVRNGVFTNVYYGQ